MAVAVINLTGHSSAKTAYNGGTYYDPTKYFDVPANAGIISAVLNFTTLQASGSFLTRTFQFNAQKAHDATNVTDGTSLNVALLVTGSNAYRLIHSAQSGANATWFIGSVTLTLTYNLPYTACGAATSVGVNATNVAPGAGVTLSWSGATDGVNNPIVSFNIYRSTSPGGALTYIGNVAAWSAVVYAPSTSGASYYYKVVSIGAVGGYDSGYSSESGALTCTLTAVTAPTSNALDVSTCYPGNYRTLTWSGAGNGTNTVITGYAIYINDVYLTTVSGTSYSLNAPGAGSYNYKVYAIANYSGYNSGASPTATLTVKQPASNLSLDVTTIPMDDSSVITGTITPYDAAYSHVMTFYLDATRTNSYTLNAGTNTKAFTVPLAWCVGVPNATSKAASCILQTKDGATVVGSTTIAFTVTVPANILPTASLAVEPVDGFGVLYLKGKSKVKLTSTDAGIQGSTIVSRSLYGAGYAGSASPWTSGILNTVGNNTMTVVVTDSRGRQATDTEVVAVLDYGLPVISIATAFRSDAAGAVLQTGEYIAVQASLVVSGITGNSGTATVKKRITGGNWDNAEAITHNTPVVLDTALEENAYEVLITLTDTVGSVSTYSMTVPVVALAFDFRNDRGGIGRVAGATTKQLLIPDDWTTNIKLGNITGDGKVGTVAGQTLKTSTDGLVTAGCPYDIGDILQTSNATSPATRWAGTTWSAIVAGTFLVAAGTGYAAGTTGGAATHTLTVGEMPSHDHQNYNTTQGDSLGVGRNVMVDGYVGDAKQYPWKTMSSTGGGGAHNNMPPYLAVYAWQRSA